MRAVWFGFPAVLLLAACGEGPDPWTAERAAAFDAAPGGATLIATHFQLGPECQTGEAPAIIIEADGALGTITTTPTVGTVDDVASECDGIEYPATEVYYEAAPGAGGFDEVVYREHRGGDQPDRLHTVSLRVR